MCTLRLPRRARPSVRYVKLQLEMEGRERGGGRDLDEAAHKVIVFRRGAQREGVCESRDVREEHHPCGSAREPSFEFNYNFRPVTPALRTKPDSGRIFPDVRLGTNRQNLIFVEDALVTTTRLYCTWSMPAAHLNARYDGVSRQAKLDGAGYCTFAGRVTRKGKRGAKLHISGRQP